MTEKRILRRYPVRLAPTQQRNARSERGEPAVDLAQITKQLEQAKAHKARLEGRREQLLRSLKDLGHDAIDSAQAEAAQIRTFLETAEPDLKEKYDNFIATHGPTLNAIKTGL